MDWKMSHESSHWQNPASFQYEFKEHSGEKVSVRDILTSQWCGERAAQQAQLCLGTGAKAGQGRDEHHCSLCGCTQGQFSLLTSLIPASIPTGFDPGFPQAVFLGRRCW